MQAILNRIIALLMRLSYGKLTLDKINQKLIKPVPGLIIDGVQYYQFVQVADMPENRLVNYADFEKELNMGVDRQTIKEYINELKVANNKADASRIGSLLFMLEDTIDNVTPIEALYNIASVLYFDRSEDVSCYDIDYNAVKIEKFKTVGDKGFFFRSLLENNFKITDKSILNDTVGYLKLSMVKQKAYARILSGLAD
jgi:hypothetical protein